MRIFSLLYNGFIWGLLAAIIAFQNEWLEMRISIGLIIPIVMLLVIVAGLISQKLSGISAGTTSINLLASLLIAFLILGGKRLAVVPAAMIRELIRRPDIGFSSVNLALILCLAVGLVVIGSWELRNK
ncbi:MAG: hypothetical protein ABFD18_16235 [Syntrophomonas sp.]